MILGMTFTDKKITVLETKSRQIIPRSEHAVAIIASYGDENAVEYVGGIVTEPAFTAMLDTSVCRVTNERTDPPARNAPLLVQTKEALTYTVEGKPIESNGTRLSIAKKKAENLLHLPFYIMVANTYKLPVYLPERTKGATFSDAPSKIVLIQGEVPVDLVNALS